MRIILLSWLRGFRKRKLLVRLVISLIAVRHKLLLQNFPPERAHFFQWLYTFFAFLVNL